MGRNALNFVRLCLALEVVVWHAYSLRGSGSLPARAEHLLDLGSEDHCSPVSQKNVGLPSGITQDAATLSRSTQYRGRTKENNVTHTEVQYMYRNGATKLHGSFWLYGGITEQQKDQLRASLDQGQYFVPEQVGIPHLAKSNPASASFPAEDHHAWHSMLVNSIGTGEASQGKPLPTIESFVRAMIEANRSGWDPDTHKPTA